MRTVVLRVLVLFLFGILFAVATPQSALAQDYTQYDRNSTARRYGDLSTVGGNPYAMGMEQDTTSRTDTTKRKIRKPLESYFFDDSTRKRPNFAWHIDTYRNKVEFTDIDTLINRFELDYPYLRKGVGDAYQGNLGGATIPLNYFDRPQYRNFNFAQSYNTYFWFPDKVNFYNVKKPFTHLSYFMAGQKKYNEESFWLTHAQNISPSSGFNIDYRSQGTRGIYNWQKGRAKDLSMAFSHTGKKYSIHAGYIFNTINNKENGGVQNDRDITDTIFELPENVPVRLQDARMVLKNNTYYVIQSYGIPLRKLTDEDFSIADRSSVFFGHSFQYSRWSRKYTDTRSQSGDYYENWYVNPTSTYDSIFETLISNRLFIQLQPWDREGVIGVIDGGIGMDNHYYYQFRQGDYLTGKVKGIRKTGYYVYGSVDGKIKRYFDWGGNIQFHPFGYRSGDMSIGAKASISAFIKGNPITLTGKFSYDRRSPDYWSEEFYSNHYAWSNSFSKENETRIEATLNIPSWGLEAGAAQSVVKNKIYYDARSMPAQETGNVSVSGLYARKDFRLGGFHLNHRVLLQWSTSQEVIPVPLASAFLSYYFEFDVVKSVLRLQVGLDGRYNTPYYAFGYNPALSQFYNQREKEIGGYPMVDVFVNAKWKRMRILLKLEHLNDNLFGDRNYFTLLHYPQNKRVLKLGFSWSFYD